MVPLSLITASIFSRGRSELLALGGGGGGENAMEWISARSTPRRSSTRQAHERVSHIRRRVPCVDAEARSVPEWLMERLARRFSWAVMREMLVGRFWWCCGRATLEETAGGVRSTSWIWPGERPGNANKDLVGLGDKAHKPGLVT